ncbi:MAG: hypothetical protein JWO91_909, partial [Acidobacteriaceae bacterium]|nr:hypothetical protein [Acidobacteriaceae bacterium]
TEKEKVQAQVMYASEAVEVFDFLCFSVPLW